MPELIGNFFRKENKNAIIVLAGTIINSLIGGAFFIMAPRLIGPQNYGLFAVVTSTGVLIATFANLGIDTGILRFASRGNSSSANRILKLALEAYLGIGISIFVLGFILARPLALFLGNLELEPLLQIAFFCITFFLLTDFFIAALQSQERFLKASLINIISNTTRLVLVGIAAYFFILNLYTLTIIFFFVTVVSTLTGAIFTPLNFLNAKNHRSEFKNFFGYNIWLAASFAISAFPFDNYLLLKFAGPVATGFYAAPFKLLSIVDQLAGNYSRVLAPKMSGSNSRSELIAIIKTTLPIIIPGSIFFLILSVFSTPLVNLILGSSYQQSIPVFRLVAIASSFTFATAIPVSIVLFYFKKPLVAFINTILIIAFWLTINLILIPLYKETGAAYAYLISEIFSFLIFAVYVFYKLNYK